MLETIITTSQAIRWALAMAGLSSILAVGMLGIVTYMLNEWRKDMNKYDDYITSHIIDTAVKEAMDRDREAL